MHCSATRRFFYLYIPKHNSHIYRNVWSFCPNVLNFCLERIAEELAGENAIKELLLPFNNLETTEIEDWKQEQNCFFCESRLHMMFEALEKLMGEVKSGKNLQDNPSLCYLQELLPYCPQFYTHNIGKEILAELKTTGHGTDKDVEMNIPQTQKEPIELKIPHIISHARLKIKENPQACKKSYTDDELTAAVNEIQSGKLGTRRASVLYGIPRSTLRNKIFRMGSDKQSIYPLNGDEGYEDALATEIALKWTDLIQGSFRPLFQHLPLMLNPDFKVMDSGDDFEKRLEYIRKQHNLSRKKEKYYTDYAHELKLPHLKKIIKKLTEERFEMERNADRVRIMSKKEVPKSQLAKSTSNEVPSLPPTPPTSDIVIPSFKPAHDQKTEKQITEQLSHSFDKYENTRLGDTLKDIIVKTISEKVRVKSQALADYCNNSLSQKTENEIVVKSEPLSPCPSPLKKVKREDYERRHDHIDHITKPLKKTRPKRGQYRKYNSQLLMEAVKAVQRGEMSVHRAGSYYGVPHSTSEYKVKERHLLRQKKIKEQKEAAARAAGKGSTIMNHSSNSNSSTGTDTEGITVKKEPEEETSTSKSALSTSWMPSYFSTSSSLGGASDMSFFGSSGYALSTPASELLRKLQHKVQTKAEESDSNSGEGYVYIH